VSQALSFGERLRRLRERAGLTQEGLAERAGLTTKAISALERGERRRPYPQTVRALADALGLDADERAALFVAAAARPGPPAPAGAAPAAPPTAAFARSKLQPPRPRTDLLPRERLIERVTARLGAARLILVSAPAGAGKTTLLAALAERMQDVASPSAWATLDADDDDPERFLAVLLAALGQLAPGAPAAAAPADPRAAVDAAVNAMVAAAPGPCLLVLDDLHLVREPAAYAALDHLIAHMPAQLTVALGTRHDPPLNLARLRARRELIELRAADLRFTLEETAGLLNERLTLGLDSGSLAELHARTEGWATGISLLAASLDTIGAPDERARFVSHLAAAGGYLFEYLAEEVLNRQDPFARAFLLETATLPELTPQACRAVTGREDAAAILDDLYRRNLFLVRLAGGPGAERADGATYRYHELFRSFLRERLRREAPEWLRQLHRRAAAADPANAAEHLLDAALWDEAAEAIARAGGLTDRLRARVEALPAEVQEAHPQLLLWLGRAYGRRPGAGPAVEALDRARAAFAAAGDAEGEGEALAWLAADAHARGDGPAAQAAAAWALAYPLPPALRVRMLMLRAAGHARAGRPDAAGAAVVEALALVEAAPEPAAVAQLLADLAGPLAELPECAGWAARAMNL
jgi:LuxR family maltose regulon positive regulatory protein